MSQDKMRVCAVCGKQVARMDEDDHLRSQHLGPHYFRLNGRPYRTMLPSMRCADLLRVLELPMNSYLWEVSGGKEVDYGHVNAIDLTHQPQLFLHVEQGPRCLQDGPNTVELISEP